MTVHTVTTTYERDQFGRETKRTVVTPEVITVTETDYDNFGNVLRETVTQTLTDRTPIVR